MGEKKSSVSPPPMVMWAQRPSLLFLTVCLEDCKDPTIEVKPSYMHFRGVGGADKSEHEVKLEFLKEIDPDKSKFAVRDRVIEFALEKKESGPYWERLLKDKTKQHWLRVDFNKWKDEDDSDNEGGDGPGGPGGQDLEEMMKQMGGLGGGMGGMPNMEGLGGGGKMERPNLDDLDVDEDSDDELPDLE